MKKNTANVLTLTGLVAAGITGMFGIARVKGDGLANPVIKLDGAFGSTTVPADGKSYTLQVEPNNNHPSRTFDPNANVITMDPGRFQTDHETVNIQKGAKVSEVDVAPDTCLTIVQGHKDGHSAIKGGGQDTVYVLSGPGNMVYPGPNFNFYNANPGMVTTIEGFRATTSAQGDKEQFFSINASADSGQSHYWATLRQIAGTNDNMIVFQSPDGAPAYFYLPSSGEISLGDITAERSTPGSTKGISWVSNGAIIHMPSEDYISLTPGPDMTTAERDQILNGQASHAGKLLASRAQADAASARG